MEKHFRLYSSCIAVKGSTHAAVFDLDRRATYPIPNLLVDILDASYHYSIPGIKAKFEHAYDEGIDAYFQRFVEIQLGFFTREPNAFPRMAIAWENPLTIQTAILEIAQQDTYNIAQAIQQLDRLGCAAIQFRFLQPRPIIEIENIFSLCEHTRIKSFECYLHDNSFKEQDYETLLAALRLSQLIIYSASAASTCHLPASLHNHPKLIFTQQQITAAMRDHITVDSFSLDARTFHEAHFFNIALNRKVCIDSQGNIKNAPSHKRIFGHINSSHISEVIHSADFTQKWKITNDMITKCKDCQYRYVCLFTSDVEQKNGEWVKVEDCGYDPIEDVWKK